MEIVRNPKIEWLKLKWLFIATSILLAVVGTVSLTIRGLNLGIDFEGGILVEVKTEGPADLAAMKTDPAVNLLQQELLARRRCHNL